MDRLAFRFPKVDREGFLRSVGLDPDRLRDGLERDRVAALLDFDLERVSRATFVRDGDEVRLADLVLRRPLWRPSGRVCLQCVREDGAGHAPADVAIHRYRRAWWDLQVIGRCECHGHRLVRHCPACAAGLGWREGSLRACRACGHDLVTTADGHSEEADWEAYVVGRLGFAPRLPSPILDGLTIGDAITFVEHLGATLAPGPNPEGPPRTAFNARVGFRLLDDGCAPLRAALASMDVDGTHRTVRQVYSTLDPVLSWLRSNSTEVLEPVRTAILDHVSRTWRLPPDSRILGRAVNQVGDTAWHALGKRLRLDAASLEALSRHLGIPLPDCRELGADDTLRFEAAVSSTMKATEVARMTGLATFTLSVLARHGVLAHVEWSKGKGRPARYGRDAAVALASSLARDVPIRMYDPDLISFDTRSRYEVGESRHHRCAALVMALLSGRVKPSGRVERWTGVTGLLFACPEAEPWQTDID